MLVATRGDYDSRRQVIMCVAKGMSTNTTPVLGLDGEKFPRQRLQMKEQSCKTQKKIVIVPKNKCQKLEEIACDGEKPLINPVTGKDYFCGDGPDSKNCPLAAIVIKLQNLQSAVKKANAIATVWARTVLRVIRYQCMSLQTRSR
ncbi:hypothetical protein TNIN_317791 [Trichonephila inaurata madagascariensis]|uniref:Uncharacterized protein n=1 Tax=Trichonephila inaurata madagascariensis TaxID=2747483 RepID=A0A8X6YUN7_9ARAC|nr:hypothetical protein TNIN_317791 [Trichonephila inaurata madagascariensis]